MKSSKHHVFSGKKIRLFLLLSFFSAAPVFAQSFEKISQEQGAQGKGNAYGKNKDKNKWFDDSESSGLGGMSASAPLPPLIVFAMLGIAFGLKSYKNRQIIQK